MPHNPKARRFNPDNLQDAAMTEAADRYLVALRTGRDAPWTPFEDVTDRMFHKADLSVTPRQALYLAYGDRAPYVRMYKNSRYVVYKVPVELDYPGGEKQTAYELSIRTVENDARHDWREFQRIKNELCGPEFEAVEIYPAESRLVDTANQFYLFVLPEGERIAFGFEQRAVREGSSGGAVQRPFEPGTRPPDCVVSDLLKEINEAVKESSQPT